MQQRQPRKNEAAAVNTGSVSNPQPRPLPSPSAVISFFFYTAELNQPSVVVITGFRDLGSCSTLLLCVLLQVTYQSG